MSFGRFGGAVSSFSTLSWYTSPLQKRRLNMLQGLDHVRRRETRSESHTVDSTNDGHSENGTRGFTGVRPR